jgi:hypothetical protein
LATKTTRIRQDAGPMTAETAAKWTRAQIYYPNHASKEDYVARARAAATAAVDEHSGEVRILRDRWRATNRMLAGNTLDRLGPEDVHIPEVAKLVKTLVPRLVGAVMDRDPWFKCKGRKPSKQKMVDTIAAHLDWQADQAKLIDVDLLNNWVLDAIVTQAGVFKTCYARRTRKFVRQTRSSTVDEETGVVTHDFVPEEVDEVVYDGWAVDLVDPFDFIVDVTRIDPLENGRYIGDRSRHSMATLQNLEQMGWFENVEEVKRLYPEGTPMDTETAFYKSERAATQFMVGTKFVNGDYEVVELWMPHDLHGDGNKVECVISMIGQVVVQVRENPNNQKFKPYAICRFSDAAHAFYGTGVLDGAIRLNQVIDRLWGHFIRGAALMATPIGVTEERGSLPDSLYRVIPGTVYEGVTGMNWMKVPNVLDAAPLVTGKLQRDIEEIVGVYKIQVGQESDGNTATQATLSLREGNKRIEHLIRSMSKGLVRVLQQGFKYNGQYLTDETTFRVLGRRIADVESDYLTIGPDFYLEDVDFVISGLSSIASHGMRATMLQSILNSTLPLIVANADRVDSLGIVHELMHEMVGPDEADRFVRLPTDPERMFPQDQENIYLLQGQQVEVSPEDPHKEHLRKIAPLLEAIAQGRIKNPRVVAFVMEHALNHELLEQRAEQERMVAEQRAQQRALAAPQSAGGQQAAPARGGLEPSLSRPGGTKDQTPGPPNMDRQPRIGGGSRPVSQSRDQESES